MTRRWPSYAGVAAVVAVDVLVALVVLAVAGAPPWLVVPFGLVDAVALAAIARRSTSGAVVAGLAVAFVLFMFAFAAGTGALSGV